MFKLKSNKKIEMHLDVTFKLKMLNYIDFLQCTGNHDIVYFLLSLPSVVVVRKNESSDQRARVCQMELCSGTRLEPTRMQWKSDQVHDSSVTKETHVQECDSAKSVCNPTFTLSLRRLVPKLTTTLTVTETKIQS